MFATATPFEKGEESTILFLKLLLFDHPNLSAIENYNDITPFLTPELFGGRISYFGYNRNTENGDFAREIVVDPQKNQYEWEGHQANLVKVTIPPESLETYKQKCGADIQKDNFELKDIADHAPEDFYKQIGIKKI